MHFTDFNFKTENSSTLTFGPNNLKTIKKK